MNRSMVWGLLFVIFALVFVVACGSGEAESGSEDQEAAEFADQSQGASDENDGDDTGNGMEQAGGGDTPGVANENETDFPENPGFEEITADGMIFRYRVVGESLDVEVEAPTTGWVAVGFDPERGMQGANLVIGYVTGNVATVEDHYGNAMTAHSSDESLGGSRNLSNVTGTEADGATSIGFRMPLNSGDEYDKALERGTEYSVLLAYGPNNADDVTTYHQFRTAVSFAVP